MEALAARLGRAEAKLDAVRQDVVSLQGRLLAASPAAIGGAALGAGVSVAAGVAGDSVGREAAVAEWVRLFELELSSVREVTDTGARRAVDALERLRVLERRQEAVQVEEDALDDLAELVLGELSRVRQYVSALSEFARGGEKLPDEPLGVEELRWQRGSLREQLADVVARLERLEEMGTALSGKAGAAWDASMRWVRDTASRAKLPDQESADELAMLKRHGASLRSLADMEARIEALQASMAKMPFDVAMSRTEASVSEMENKARNDLGTLTVFDSYRLQAGLDQVMAAMEALTRQRNDDIALLNSYLDEVYKRLERDLPSRRGLNDNAKMRADVDDLAAKLENVAGVQFREVEARLLREAQLGRDEALAVQGQVARVETAARQALEQSAELGVHVRLLQEASAARTAGPATFNSELGEFRRELTAVRLELGELTSAGGGTLQLETRLTMVRAEVEALLELKLREAAQRSDELEMQLHAIRQETLHLDSEAQARLAADVERLTSELTATQRDATALDVALRERIGRAERETRSEVRMLQQLVLEVGERARLPSGASPKPKPPALELMASGANLDSESVATPRPGPELDVGALALEPDGVAGVTWRVTGVRARVRSGDGRALVSPSFDYPRLASASGLRLKLFPLGSRRTRRPGYCALYISGREGVQMQFVLRLGGAEHGPLEAIFDRREKESGRHDFCVVEEELEADGSALVHVIVTRAERVG